MRAGDYVSTFEGEEVQEAIAEMFNLSYRNNAPVPAGIAGCPVSELMRGGSLCWMGGLTVPSHYSSYNCNTDEEHLNGYILGRAFHLMRETIPHADVRRLLMKVPFLLPAKRTFGAVHTALENAADTMGRPDLGAKVHDALIAAGVKTSSTRESTCG